MTTPSVRCISTPSLCYMISEFVYEKIQNSEMTCTSAGSVAFWCAYDISCIKAQGDPFFLPMFGKMIRHWPCLRLVFKDWSSI